MKISHVFRFCSALALLTLGTLHAEPHAEATATPATPVDPAVVAKQSRAASLLENSGSLVTNGDFQTPSQGGEGAKDWGNPSAGVSRVEQDGKAFMRLKVVEPGKMYKIFRAIDLPAGTEGLELKWRWRIEDLERGADRSNDARIIFAFRDASGATIKERPNPAYFGSKSSKGWVEKTARFSVPKGAVALEFMPTLFKANAGTLDIDDVTLRPVDKSVIEDEKRATSIPPDLAPEPAKPENFPKPIRVKGNRLVNDDGQEVWLQGVNVAGLEWNTKGESVLRRTVEAIDNWKSTVIRLPIKSESWNGPQKEAYRALVDAAITMAANRGAYVVVDLHSYRAIKPEHIEFWKEFATKYKNHPAVLFDVLNEPHGIDWEVWRNGGFVEEASKKGDEDAFLSEEDKKKNKQGFQSPGMQAAVEAIRSTGAENVLVAGGLKYSLDLSGILKGYALEDKSGRGIMYATHVYNWHNDWQTNFLDVAAVHPILVGELGADYRKMEFISAEAQEDPATWVPDMLGLIQKHKLNWTGWCFHPNAGPRMLADWTFAPTKGWGELAKRALAGEQFEMKKQR